MLTNLTGFIGRTNFESSFASGAEEDAKTTVKTLKEKDFKQLLGVEELKLDSEQKSNFTNNSKYTYFYSFSELDEVEQKLKNAYLTLELPINSSAEDVHRQYRKLIFKYHPDRLSEHQRQNPAMIKEAKEKIEAIYSAYHLICEHQNKKIG